MAVESRYVQMQPRINRGASALETNPMILSGTALSGRGACSSRRLLLAKECWPRNRHRGAWVVRFSIAVATASRLNTARESSRRRIRPGAGRSVKQAAPVCCCSNPFPTAPPILRLNNNLAAIIGCAFSFSSGCVVKLLGCANSRVISAGSCPGATRGLA